MGELRLLYLVQTRLQISGPLFVDTLRMRQASTRLRTASAGGGRSYRSVAFFTPPTREAWRRPGLESARRSSFRGALVVPLPEVLASAASAASQLHLSAQL